MNTTQTNLTVTQADTYIPSATETYKDMVEFAAELPRFADAYGIALPFSINLHPERIRQGADGRIEARVRMQFSDDRGGRNITGWAAALCLPEPSASPMTEISTASPRRWWRSFGHLANGLSVELVASSPMSPEEVTAWFMATFGPSLKWSEATFEMYDKAFHTASGWL